MIIVEILGGLGNQMFQYAFARALSLRSRTEFKLDVTPFEAYSLRKYELEVFDINPEIATEEEIEELKKKRLFNNTYIKEKSLKYNAKYAKSRKNGYFRGYWQCEKYFIDASDVIRKDFTLKSPLSETAGEYAERITAANSVSLHIRRGDYVGNPHHEVDLTKYYKNAISTIREKTDNPEFFIFSDDIEYAHCCFEDFNLVQGCRGIEDMHLMSLCKHNIIANSSFSWWGAWLNDNPYKTVIAPKRWFAGKKYSSATIIPESWIRL